MAGPPNINHDAGMAYLRNAMPHRALSLTQTEKLSILYSS
jgi:hypothetical protein